MLSATKYQPKDFEETIKNLWEKEQVYSTLDHPSSTADSKKIYCLSMFPYPSGAGLHVGHVRIYTGTDVLARYLRMKGFNVLHPMGWDAFGLPAENAAIKAKKNPMDIVPGNIETFKRQMQSLGFSYDWSREFSTTDPSYYRWTQWLFVQLYKMGLLYKKDTPINWCPSCKTGLSEEEVLPNGTHERCGNAITKKDLPQWIFRITTYADRLLKDLDGLDWPEGILTMQRNWIGRKEGINITYKVVAPDPVDGFIPVNARLASNTPDLRVAGSPKTVATRSVGEVMCFTTRPDTNFGATFVVVAPEHAFVEKILAGNIKSEETKCDDIKQYVEKAKAKTEIERGAKDKKKTGVFTGFYAVNQLTGRKMPIWISDFVLMGFGTGAVVGVPGHDMRDFEFAKEYGIEVLRVVLGQDDDASPIIRKEQVQEESGKMVNSGFLDGMDIHVATKKMMDHIEDKGYGKRVSTFHLRDWIFSRQRYWGEPIPMVYCESCAKSKISWWNTEKGKAFKKTHQNIIKLDDTLSENMAGWFPISEQNLPLELPYVKSYEPTGTGESPLSKIRDFVKTACPNCGGDAKRETDTMPNWAGSCWYFLKFTSPDFIVESAKKPSRVNLSDRHIHSRSFSSDSTQLPWEQKDMQQWMPVDWYLGGAEHAVLHLLYSRFWMKALQDLGFVNFSEPFLRLRNVGMVLAEDNRKMSKSWGNVINPDDVIEEFGADALRVYEMFMAPFNMEIAWSTAALQGAYRFLNRIWQLYHRYDKIDERIKSKQVQSLIISLHKTIKKVEEDISQTKFNTAVAAMMEFLNEWEKGTVGLSREEAKKFLIILSPFAPFLAEKLWRSIYKERKSICLASWPEINADDLVALNINLPVQINGKVRAVITIPSTYPKDETEKRALQEEKVKEFIEGRAYKIIFVPGKILNFVLSSETTTRT